MAGLPRSRQQAPLRRGGAVLQAGETSKQYIMAKPSEAEIRMRAHELWEQAGKPEGREDQFWHLAEQEPRLSAKQGHCYFPVATATGVVAFFVGLTSLALSTEIKFPKRV